ncbi:NAD(P)-binding protein [Xylona heveae TC161]|uniref:NAD(P)-binding protein n=1 Tax=Xylona heveae (strain CBS 132557 / TC161) TaxID=1328760 RepID=A0A165JR33_XYLHT|nr:NAD(P)-binding protein [Xylona heveae TC161]KZF26530.1 NAD(P)-binding protein [Xylona heveae TC161]
MTTTFTTPKKQLTWLITGCSSGFGLSLTRIAQAEGDKVIATSRNPSRTPELVREVESKGGKWLQLDLDNPNNAQVIEQLENSGQEIDVLVNNAGFSIFSPVETSTEEEYRAQMESMYFGPLRLIRAVLPHMRKRRFGIIVNMSSGAALEGRDTMGGYAGAKAGLDGTCIFSTSILSELKTDAGLVSWTGVTKVMAKEVAPFNVRTLTVNLGTFNTDMPNAATFGKNPLPDDYQGSVSAQMIQVIKSGKLPILGDKDKAMKAVYEVVVGEGVGAGYEAERFLPLGSDMTPRVKQVQQYLAHGLEVFGHVTDNVNLDR